MHGDLENGSVIITVEMDEAQMGQLARQIASGLRSTQEPISFSDKVFNKPTPELVELLKFLRDHNATIKFPDDFSFPPELREQLPPELSGHPEISFHR